MRQADRTDVEARRAAEKEASDWLKEQEAEFNRRYERELMNPREALSLGSISEIVPTNVVLPTPKPPAMTILADFGPLPPGLGAAGASVLVTDITSSGSCC